MESGNSALKGQMAYVLSHRQIIASNLLFCVFNSGNQESRRFFPRMVCQGWDHSRLHVKESSKVKY